MSEIFEAFIKLEPIQKFTVTSLFFTLLVSIGTLFFSIRNNKRNIYANTILKERIDSLASLKISTAKFLSIASSINVYDESDNYRELVYLSNLISFQLNSSKEEEKKIQESLRYLIQLFEQKIRISHRDNNIIFLKKQIKSPNLEIDKMKEDEILDKIQSQLSEISGNLAIHIKNEWEKSKKL